MINLKPSSQLSSEAPTASVILSFARDSESLVLALALGARRSELCLEPSGMGLFHPTFLG